MKYIFTKNILYFARDTLILAILFRYFLTLAISNKLFLYTWLNAAVYFSICFFLGYYYGRKEYKEIPLANSGLRFHITTYLVHNLVAYSWIYFDFIVPSEKNSIHYTALFWGIGLFVHIVSYFMFKNKSIKGISSEDVFE